MNTIAKIIFYLFVTLAVVKNNPLFASHGNQYSVEDTSIDTSISEEDKIFYQEISDRNFENLNKIKKLDVKTAIEIASYFTNEKTDGIDLSGLQELPIEIAEVLFKLPFKQPYLYLKIDNLLPKVATLISKSFMGGVFVFETKALSNQSASSFKKMMVGELIVKTDTLYYKTAAALKGFMGAVLTVETKYLKVLDRVQYPIEKYPVEVAIEVLKGAKCQYLFLKFPNGNIVDIGKFKRFMGQELSFKTNTFIAGKTKNITKFSNSKGYSGYQGEILKIIVEDLKDDVLRELIRFPNVLAIATTTFKDSNIEALRNFQGKELRLKTNTFTDLQFKLIIDLADAQKLNILLVINEISESMKKEVEKSSRIEIELL